MRVEATGLLRPLTDDLILSGLRLPDKTCRAMMDMSTGVRGNRKIMAQLR